MSNKSNKATIKPELIFKPPKNLLRPVGRAIADFEMINANDRILLGLSGGKDSLTLLHVLMHLQRHAPIQFDLAVITIDPISDSFDPSSLKPYIESLGLPYFYQRQPIMELGIKHINNDSYCAWCARMKRGIMYTTARQHGYNVLALAQHLDDFAESFLMSAFHGGQLRTMKANYLVKQKDLRVIRPLVYARERQCRAFAQQANLPVIVENCPACFKMPTQRQHMKELLSQEESQNKRLFGSLLTAMSPLIAKKDAS